MPVEHATSSITERPYATTITSVNARSHLANEHRLAAAVLNVFNAQGDVWPHHAPSPWICPARAGRTVDGRGRFSIAAKRTIRTVRGIVPARPVVTKIR